MKQYSRPALRDLGSMAVVTRKSGIYNDAPQAVQVTRAMDEGGDVINFLCNVLGLTFLSICQPA